MTARRVGARRADLHFVRELVHVAEDRDAGVGEAEPAGHLDDEGAAGVLLEVVAVDGEGREAEDGMAGAVGGKVDEHAEGVAGAAVVHVGHVGAQVRVLRPFYLHHSPVGRQSTVFLIKSLIGRACCGASARAVVSTTVQWLCRRLAGRQASS